MRTPIGAALMAAMMLVGCGTSSSSSKPASVADVKAAVAKNGMAEQADCIAQKMVDDGITQAQLDELKKWNGKDPAPEGGSIYRSARDRCAPLPAVPR